MLKHKKLLASPGFEVGYAKPPKGTRFEKGKSGNPKGRPVGSKNKAKKTMGKLNDLIMKEAYRDVDLNDKTGPLTMPVAQAVVRSINLNAAKGRVGAQRLFLEMLGTVEGIKQREKQDIFEAAHEYKEHWTAELKRLKQAGYPLPELLPHPDDIELNAKAGEVIFHGPFDHTEKKVWDYLWSQHTQYSQEAEDMRAELAETEDPEERGHIEDQLDWTQYLFQVVALQIMENWRLPAKRVASDVLLRKVLEQHVAEGTKPTSPRDVPNERFDYAEFYRTVEERRRAKLVPAGEGSGG